MTFDPQAFDDAWRRYTEKATEAHAPFMSYLNAGAPADAIAAAERAVGCAFSDDLRHLLARHDGSDDHFVLPGWELFPAARIAKEWAVWADLYRTRFKPEGYDCEPNGPVCGDEWWRLKWIPFCGDGGGNHLCIDMEPADGGTPGQVITLWHDEPARNLIAPSLTGFIEIIAEDFEDGALIWDEDWGGVYAAPDED